MCIIIPYYRPDVKRNFRVFSVLPAITIAEVPEAVRDDLPEETENVVGEVVLRALLQITLVSRDLESVVVATVEVVSHVYHYNSPRGQCQALVLFFLVFLMPLTPYVTPLYVNRAGLVSGGFRGGAGTP
tara:strand:- start:63 stop:449 length:387 start_codon:yes stop_codon:yes gene_type:complete